MPKISIIMPVYGVEKYIPKAIDSVLDQTFTDWELIIVNDGSKDRSGEIALEYSSKDKRIKVLEKENGGLSDARNFGLKYVKGKYIHFFDSDDWIEKDFYETLIAKIDHSSLDLVICGYFVDQIIEDQLISTSERKCFNLASSHVYREQEVNSIGGYINYAWNKLFRSSFLIDNDLNFDTNLYRIEDAEFMCRVLSKNPNIEFIEYLGYHYMNRDRQTLGSIIDERTIDFTISSIEITRKTLKYLKIDDIIIKNYISKFSLSLIKYVIDSIYKAQSGVENRIYFLKKILSHHDIKTMIKNSTPTNKKDSLFKFLLQNNMYRTINILCIILR